METLQQIAVDKLRPSPLNPRKAFDEKKTKELAESITAKGILQPVVVRLGDKAGAYEIICGDRRVRAARLACLVTVPAIVRVFDDAAALEVMAIENGQREDVLPLEEAAGYQALIKIGKYDVKALAVRVGKSKEYIYARMQLLKLPVFIREALAIGKLPPEHAQLIGRLPTAAQKDAYKNAFIRVWGSGCAVETVKSVRDFRSWIQQYVYRDLSAASWKLDDAGLIPRAGACLACARRTGYQPQLFSDAKRDCCLDGKCFGAKLDAAMTRHRAHLEAAGEKILSLSTEYVHDNGKRGLLGAQKWKKVKPNASGAVKGFLEDGPQRGKLISVRLEGTAKTRKASAVAAGVPGADAVVVPLAERRKTLGLRRKASAVAAVRARLAKAPLKTLVAAHTGNSLMVLVGLAAHFGTKHRMGYLVCSSGCDPWASMGENVKAGGVIVSLWDEVRGVLEGRLEYSALAQLTPFVGEAVRVCDLLGWSWQAFLDDAAEILLEPKLWASLRPDGKPKARPASKSTSKPAAKPAAKLAAKSAAKPAAKSAAKSAAKPVAKSAAKPVAKSAAKPVAKSAAKPVAKGRRVRAAR